MGLHLPKPHNSYIDTKVEVGFSNHATESDVEKQQVSIDASSVTKS